jgi:hypothetical protein
MWLSVEATCKTYTWYFQGLVCDDYFVPVLEVICGAMRLKPDVAGATFMAAGEKASKE